MSEQPTGRRVNCPECNSSTMAIVPERTRLVDRKADADGKVWAPCLDCDHRFLVYFEFIE